MIGRDASDGQEKRLLYRDGHLTRLEKLETSGRLLLAGPFEDKSGSLIVFEADSLEAAKDFAKNDPYVIKGIFSSYEVKPFKKVFPRS